MEKLKGKVDRVKTPDAPNKPYGVCIGGNWYNTFDKELGTRAQAGYLVEYEYEVNEKGFSNLTDLTVIEAGVGTPVSSPKPWAGKKSYSSGGQRVSKRDPDEERRITRMASINSSLKYWELVQKENPETKINLDNITNIAEELVSFVYEKKKDKPKGNNDISAFL